MNECLICGQPCANRYCSQTCNGERNRRTAAALRLPRDCVMCGATFQPPHPYRRVTCSKACRYRMVSEGHKVNPKVKRPEPTPEQIEAARRRITGPNAPWWNGGRCRRADGYMTVKPPSDWPWPEMVPKRGYIRKHRVVMALHLGRALRPAEVVHHRNKDKRDNRIENLELFASNGEHCRRGNH